MERISARPGDMKQDYEVVVIGSGYGGAIIASRLARAGREVCLVERGSEMLPGEYPDSVLRASDDFQIHTGHGDVGLRHALYELHVDEDINVFKGCGLGGTSLVNANVAIHPDERIFADERWPVALRADYDSIKHGMERAKKMLGSTPYPQARIPLAKTAMLERMAEGVGHPFHLPSINVTFEDGVNEAGVAQPACTGCGDCVTGCNVGAKNTLLMNYLPDAHRWGAKIFTGVDVRWIQANDDGTWAVKYYELSAGRGRFGENPMTVNGAIVVVAGGSLGSTEIMLRSAAHGLPVSPRLGSSFSGNGDVLAFAFDCDDTVNGIGWGHENHHADRPPVGPCITGVIDAREGPLDEGIIIEEGAIPGALAHLMPMGLALAGKESKDHPAWLERVKKGAQALVDGAYKGPLNRTQTFLVMGNEPTAGTMDLQEDRLRIHWGGIGSSPMFERIDQALEQATESVGGGLVPNPLWHDLQKQPLITVHPLGGCPMGDTAEDGAVDHLGTVFSGPNGTDVHAGLHVCDGAVVPRPLGVNPLLTISAIAERTAALIAKDRGWKIDYDGQPKQPPAAPATGMLLEFTEKIVGHVGAGAATFEEGAAAGIAAGDECYYELSMSADAKTITDDPSAPTNAVGVIGCTALSPDLFSVEGGYFRLFVPDGDRSGNSQMHYELPMRGTDGRQFHMSGFKSIDKGAPWDLWHDTTTLFVTIHHDGPDGDVWGKGILKISALDFAKQMTTMHVSGAAPTLERLEALTAYGRMFFGHLFDYYAGPLGWWRLNDKDVQSPTTAGPQHP